MKTVLIMTIEHSKPILDLTDIAAGRVYTLDGVKDVTATIQQPTQLGTQSSIDAALYRYGEGKSEQGPGTKFDSLEHISKISIAMAGIDPNPNLADKQSKKPGFWSRICGTKP